MEPINTDLYTLHRKEDNTIVRIDGLGGESPELTQEYYTSQLAFHKQVRRNLEAQRDKLVEFEAENPPFEIEEPEEPTDDPVVEQ